MPLDSECSPVSGETGGIYDRFPVSPETVGIRDTLTFTRKIPAVLTSCKARGIMAFHNACLRAQLLLVLLLKLYLPPPILYLPLGLKQTENDPWSFKITKGTSFKYLVCLISNNLNAIYEKKRLQPPCINLAWKKSKSPFYVLKIQDYCEFI